MLEINYSEFVNEEMGMISQRKLRDALHDIIVALGPKETIDVEELANQLQAEFKITISPFFLDKFLDDFNKKKRGDNKARTFFKREDQRWLGVREIGGSKQIRNNLPFMKPSLAKHKRKLFADEEKKRLDDAYKAGMKDLSFSEDVIKNSLVLQKPSDSEEMMKYIYSEVVIDKKFDNTYDNCWKLMMLMGRARNLDRMRGYFKLAPQSVKDEYHDTGKITYELTKPKVKVAVKNKKEIDIPPETKSNLSKIDKYLNKYKSWTEFISDITLRDLIIMIDNLGINMNLATHSTDSINSFLSKIDELNLILIKFYRVDKKDVIMFFVKIGLAGYLKEWEAMHARPKINDF